MILQSVQYFSYTKKTILICLKLSLGMVLELIILTNLEILSNGKGMSLEIIQHTGINVTTKKLFQINVGTACTNIIIMFPYEY